MKRLSQILLAVSLAATAGAQAAVSPEEAAKLGNELTPWGAIAAGNADGSIPAWEGPLPESKWPVGASHTKPTDPYADEKPLYTITADNMGEYAELLTEGTQKLLQGFADDGFKINVYPGHRHAFVPDWIAENFKYNATHTSLAADGRTLDDVHAAPPFPIPQNGLEVLWNHLLRWEGVTHWKSDAMSFYIDENGNQVLSNDALNTVEYPFYNPDKDYGTGSENDFWYIRIDYNAPARRAGEKLLVKDPLDFTGSAGRKAWQYLKGQRRVRRAPAVAFDTPNPGTSGLATYDEGFMFNGSPERYNWKLIGKKEMIVPYHNFDIAYHSPRTETIGKKFVNPDLTRWEKHRVWVVEATLKDGARHVYHKRVYYFDEDTLAIVLGDQYDGQDKLWRTTQSLAPVNYVLGSGFVGGNIGYDLIAGIYYVGGYSAESKIAVFDPEAPQESANFYSPQGLARGGVR